MAPLAAQGIQGGFFGNDTPELGARTNQFRETFYYEEFGDHQQILLAHYCRLKGAGATGLRTAGATEMLEAPMWCCWKKKFWTLFLPGLATTGLHGGSGGCPFSCAAGSRDVSRGFSSFPLV